MSEFLEKYFADYKEVLDGFLNKSENRTDIQNTINLLKGLKNSKSVVYLIGNGGSSAVVEHIAIDFTKCNKIRSIAFSGTPTLTCLANDYGYEQIFQKCLESYANKGDVLIAVSSSGSSKNILNACEAAKKIGMKIITFSGFQENNPLRSQGDFNFWVNSKSFGYLEIIHNLLLHYINDAIYGSAEYVIKG